jgi:isochorismate pyruvate lyase
MSNDEIKMKRDALSHRNITCQNMQDLRSEIDLLDRHLVELISIRQGYMEQAAVLKQSRDQVRDEERVEDVVSKVISHSDKVGADPELIEMTYRNMIEWCINFELKTYDKIRDKN